jgi:protein-S-isoprenylcysteine O-methyltransferase Ste14
MGASSAPAFPDAAQDQEGTLMADTPLTPNRGSLGIEGQKPTVKSVAEFWVRNPIYLSVFIVATAGSLVSGFIPGWGGAVNVICTLVAAVTGFKAGVKYHVEITR